LEPSLKEIKEDLKAGREEMLAKMEVRIEDDKDKFEVLRDTIVSRMFAQRERMMP
jgi:hypothetical protein